MHFSNRRHTTKLLKLVTGCTVQQEKLSVSLINFSAKLSFNHHWLVVSISISVKYDTKKYIKSILLIKLPDSNNTTGKIIYHNS